MLTLSLKPRTLIYTAVNRKPPGRKAAESLQYGTISREEYLEESSSPPVSQSWPAAVRVHPRVADTKRKHAPKRNDC